MCAAKTCLIWATVLSSVFLGIVLGGAVPCHAASTYTLEQFLSSPGCTSVDISPDRTRIYARTQFGDWDEGATAFDFSSYAKIREYHAFDVPWSILTSADNLYLYGSHYYGGLVDKVSVATDTVIRSVDVGNWTSYMGFDAARRFLYVDENTPGTGSVGSIKVIDTSQATMPVVGSIGLGGEPGCFPVVSPDGANLYVNSWNARKLYRISTSDYTIKMTYSGLSQNSFVSSLSPDGSKVYVADRGPGLVRVLDAVNLTQLETYSIPGIAEFSVSPTGRYALALNSTGPSVQVFDMTSKSVVQTIAIPTSNASAGRIVWDAPTGKAYVPLNTLSAGGGVAVIAPQPETHVLCIGVRDTPSKHGGDWAAYKVSQAFESLGTIEDTNLVTFTTENSNTSDYIRNSVNEMKLRVRPGDTFVFYINCHGDWRPTGKEAEVNAQYDPNDLDLRKKTTGNEYLYLSRGNSGDNMDDDTFTGLFVDETWEQVNKLFIMNCCFSGGFWGTTTNGDTGDLARLSKVALIASASEADFSWAARDSDLGLNLGVLGTSLAAALDSMKGKESISFEDLYAAIDANGKLFAGLKGYIEGVEDNWLVEAPISFDLLAAKSGDFQGTIPAPEPATLSLLALGGLAALLRKRR